MQEIFARDAKTTEHPTFSPSPNATRDVEPQASNNSSEPKSASGKLSATERLRRLEQQKARLQLVENKIKTEVPRGKQDESPASIKMRIAGALARRSEGEARA